MALRHPKGPGPHRRDVPVEAVFTREMGRVPMHQLPIEEIAPEVAYQIVHDELILDGNARLNLATFVTTYMDPRADKLMAETFDKNMIDKDEYAQRVTMLGGLALTRRWQKRRRAEGKPTDKPNLVSGINVQVCWDKFANYWDVEMRLVPMEGDRYHSSPEEAVKLCDENTIGVVVVMGSTFDGSYEDVKKTSELLDDLQERTGLDIPIQVDGVSGGFVAPFLDPDLEWDFWLSRVVVRRGFTMGMADMLLDDLRKKVKELEKLPAPLYNKDPGGFHHRDAAERVARGLQGDHGRRLVRLRDRRHRRARARPDRAHPHVPQLLARDRDRGCRAVAALAPHGARTAAPRPPQRHRLRRDARPSWRFRCTEAPVFPLWPRSPSRP